MDQSYFFAGIIVSALAVMLVLVAIGKTAYSVESGIIESCNVAGSFVLDGKAYKCELIQ